MKQFFVFLFSLLFLGSCVPSNSNRNVNKTAAETYATKICDFLFIECHDNTFRNMSNEWTALYLQELFHKANPFKALTLTDRNSFVDTSSGPIVGGELYCDSVEYEIGPFSSQEELDTSKLQGLVFNFRVNDFSQTDELLDSMEARLMNIYNHGNNLAEQTPPVVKEMVDELKNNPNYKEVKYIQTPSITFLITLKTTKELTFIVHFS